MVKWQGMNSEEKVLMTLNKRLGMSITNNRRDNHGKMKTV